MTDSESLASSGAAADQAFPTEPAGAAVKGCKNPTWVDYQLVDGKGAPIAGYPFKLTLSDGTVKRGATDADGFAGLDGVDPGSCTVEFVPEGA